MTKKAVNSIDSLLPIFIYWILMKHSSEENPLSRSMIQDLLSDEYGVEIGKGDRNKVSRCIRTLTSSRLFQRSIVEKKKSKTKNSPLAWYWNPTYAPNNALAPEEVNMLIDMVASSKIISSECTSALIHKLASCFGKVAQKVAQTAKAEESPYKRENNDLLRHARTVERAICEYRQLQLIYKPRTKEVALTVAPVSIRYRDNDFYLSAFFKGKIYDFDGGKICSVTVGDEEQEHFGNVSALENEKKTLKQNKVIALDLLFHNKKKIGSAISQNRFITFNYLHYTAKDAKVTLTPSEPQSVYPINTVYKNEKYYLIAINSEGKYVFFRMDLMSNVELDATVESLPAPKIKQAESHRYTDAHPYMLSGFAKRQISFLIKDSALDRVIDAFGYTARPQAETSTVQTVSENRRKLIAADPSFHQSLTGFEASEKLIEFSVVTTEEEAVRWALENADAVEIVSPDHLRLKLRELSSTLHTRYSKSTYDRAEKAYRDIVTGQNELVYGQRTAFDEQLFQQIAKDNAYAKVKRLAIRRGCAQLPAGELERYTAVESLRIEGDTVRDFSFLEGYTSLSELTLIDTPFADGSILTKLPNLKVLYLHRNSIADYSFLKDMRGVQAVYLGHNKAVDLSPLYEVDGIDCLILEENLLDDLDIKRLVFGDPTNAACPPIVRRWIADGQYRSFPISYPLNTRLLERND